MSDQEYNGWPNYETWCVNLWLTNDEREYNFWLDQAKKSWKKSRRTKVLTRAEKATYDLADLMKEAYEESMQELLESAKITGTVWHDLLGAALSEVRWDHIAKHLIEEVCEISQQP